MRKIFVIIAVMVLSMNKVQAIPESVIKAIELQEGGKIGQVIFDSNRRNSYGIFQIQEAYLQDANQYLKTNFTIEQVKNSREISIKVVAGYLSRYSEYYKKRMGVAPSNDMLLMMHNGGGMIWKRSHTNAFKNARVYSMKANEKYIKSLTIKD